MRLNCQRWTEGTEEELWRGFGAAKISLHYVPWPCKVMWRKHRKAITLERAEIRWFDLLLCKFAQVIELEAFVKKFCLILAEIIVQYLTSSFLSRICLSLFVLPFSLLFPLLLSSVAVFVLVFIYLVVYQVICLFVSRSQSRKTQM